MGLLFSSHIAGKHEVGWCCAAAGFSCVCRDAVAWQPAAKPLGNSNFSTASEVGAGQIDLIMRQHSVALLVQALRKISVTDLKTAHALFYFAIPYLHYFLFIINQSSFPKDPESQPRILAKQHVELTLPTSPPCSHGAKRWRSTLPLTTSLASIWTQRILPPILYISDVSLLYSFSFPIEPYFN